MKNKYTITKAEVLALGFKESEVLDTKLTSYPLTNKKWLTFDDDKNVVGISSIKKKDIIESKLLTKKQVKKKINKHIAKQRAIITELENEREYKEVKKEFIKMTDEETNPQRRMNKLIVQRKTKDELIEMRDVNNKMMKKGCIDFNLVHQNKLINERLESINNNGVEKSTEVVDELEEEKALTYKELIDYLDKSENKDVYSVAQTSKQYNPIVEYVSKNGERLKFTANVLSLYELTKEDIEVIERKGNVPKMHNPPPPPIKKGLKDKSLNELKELLKDTPINSPDYNEIKRTIRIVNAEIKTENARQSKLSYNPKFNITKLNYFKWSIFIAILIWLYIGVNNMLEQKHYHLATVLSFALGFVMYDVLFTIKKEITEWKNK